MQALGPKFAEELQFNWKFWARPDQLEPEGHYRIWMPLAGRGWGKTRTGAETVREWVKQGLKRIACVAPTKGDVRRVMVEGNSGLLNICHKDDKTHRGAEMGYPVWSPTNNTLTWANGAKAEFFSAEDPERLRGPQFHAAWCFTEGHKVTLGDLSQISVEEITKDHTVMTSDGPNRVVDTSYRDMPVGLVKFSNGTTLEGTFDHPVYTQRGWVELGRLKGADLCITMGMSGESTPKATTTQLVSEPCTDTLQEKSSGILKDSTYTTSTEINSITTPQTYNLLQDQSTSSCTMVKEVCQRGSQKDSETSSVSLAEKLSNVRQSLALVSTAKAANTKERKKKESLPKTAYNVGKSSSPDTEPCVVSVVSTWQPTGVKTVYNLQVENTSEYFCNGILTHNCDEVAAWRNMQSTWDMLQFTLRLGKNPKVLITTTPKPVKLIRNIIALSKDDPKSYVVSTGSSYDNKDNIDLEALKQYEGTRLGRQELYAEVLEEAAGALWSVELLDKAQIHESELPGENLEQALKHFSRIVVAVDPAVSSNEESDMTGIVVAATDINGVGYILRDATDQYTPSAWAKKVVELYYEYGADRIVAERNQGGDMVRHTIETEDPTVPIRLVHASRGKFARAEPVSALYEQGRVKHLPGLDELEQQMVTWEPLGSIGSPDRLDACVWALTDLMLGGILKPNLNLSYTNSQETKTQVLNF